MDCSLPGSSIHGIFQARVLEWVAIAFFVIQCRCSQIQVSSSEAINDVINDVIKRVVMKRVITDLVHACMHSRTGTTETYVYKVLWLCFS